MPGKVNNIIIFPAMEDNNSESAACLAETIAVNEHIGKIAQELAELCNRMEFGFGYDPLNIYLTGEFEGVTVHLPTTWQDG